MLLLVASASLITCFNGAVCWRVCCAVCYCVVWGDGGFAGSVCGDLVLALGALLTGVGLLPLQSGVVPPYDHVISGTYYTTQCDAYKLASQKAIANALLMSGLSANLAFYQSVDLASGESRLDNDVPSAGSKRARVNDGDGVTVKAVQWSRR